MGKVSYYTKEGYERIKEELRVLKTKGRKDIAEQIAEARAQGDLSENAEYDAAKDAQGLLELKISKLEEKVANARLIDESNIDPSKVAILSIVKVLNHKFKKEFVYTLVPEEESNIKEGKISIQTPIAKGLLGKKVGDKVDIQVPAGKMTFEILELSR